MKVLFINTVYRRGSIGRIMHDIGSVLEEQGHSYMVAYGRGQKTEDSHGWFIGGKYTAHIHALLSRFTDKGGFYSTKATKELVRFIRQYQPDIIHLHNLHGYYINIEVLFRFLKEEFTGKVIWTLHDCWAFTGHCAYYAYVKCDKWKTHCCKCSQKGKYPKSVFLDNSRDNYARKKQAFTGVANMTIVTPSEWLAQQVKESFLGEYPCRVINNGIDLAAFSLQDVEKDKKMLLNVADGLDDRKGHTDLFRLIELLPEDYKLVIVGLKKQDLKHIPKKVIPVLHTETLNELARYYSQAGWFVNTTYEDTFPTVNMEALACGTPVITYRSGGSPEIPDETCGVTVEPGDISAIAEVITKQTPPASEACIARAGEYDKWKKFREYVELYKENQ